MTRDYPAKRMSWVSGDHSISHPGSNMAFFLCYKAWGGDGCVDVPLLGGGTFNASCVRGNMDCTRHEWLFVACYNGEWCIDVFVILGVCVCVCVCVCACAG